MLPFFFLVLLACAALGGSSAHSISGAPGPSMGASRADLSAQLIDDDKGVSSSEADPIDAEEDSGGLIDGERVAVRAALMGIWRTFVSPAMVESDRPLAIAAGSNDMAQRLYRQLYAQFDDPLSPVAVEGGGNKFVPWLDLDFALSLKGMALVAQHPDMVRNIDFRKLRTSAGDAPSEGDATYERTSSTTAAASEEGGDSTQETFTSSSGHRRAKTKLDSVSPSPTRGVRILNPPNARSPSGLYALKTNLVKAMAHSSGSDFVSLSARNVENVLQLALEQNLPRHLLTKAHIISALFDLAETDVEPAVAHWHRSPNALVVLLNDDLAWLLNNVACSAVLYQTLRARHSRIFFVAIEPEDRLRVDMRKVAPPPVSVDGASVSGEGMSSSSPSSPPPRSGGNPFAGSDSSSSSGGESGSFTNPFGDVPMTPIAGIIGGRTFQIVIQNGTATVTPLPSPPNVALGVHGAPGGGVFPVFPGAPRTPRQPSQPSDQQQQQQLQLQLQLRKNVQALQQRIQQQMKQQRQQDWEHKAVAAILAHVTPGKEPGTFSFPLFPPGTSEEDIAAFMHNPANQDKIKAMLDSVMRAILANMPSLIGLPSNFPLAGVQMSPFFNAETGPMPPLSELSPQPQTQQQVDNREAMFPTTEQRAGDQPEDQSDETDDASPIVATTDPSANPPPPPPPPPPPQKSSASRTPARFFGSFLRQRQGKDSSETAKDEEATIAADAPRLSRSDRIAQMAAAAVDKDSARITPIGVQCVRMFEDLTLEAPRDPKALMQWDNLIEEEIGQRIAVSNKRLINAELQRCNVRRIPGILKQLEETLCLQVLNRDQVRSIAAAAIKLQASKSAHKSTATDLDAPASEASELVLSQWALDVALSSVIKCGAPRFGKPSSRSKEEIEAMPLDKYEKALVANVMTPQDIGVTYDMIGGLDNVKEALRQCVTYPLKYPRLYREGIAAEGVKGVLLFGPPGTGKTMLAKAVATEGGATFLTVDSAAIESKWLGESEKNARAVFTLARRLAPCVVYLDEVDSILSSREAGDDSSHGTLTSVKTTLMQEWDGLRTTKDRVMVIASTNRPFDLDEAVLRRLPRRIMVDLPDVASRRDILAVTLAHNRIASDVNLTALAGSLEGYTGSDIKEICREAVVRVSHERAHALESGNLNATTTGDAGGNEGVDPTATLRPVTMEDFRFAVKKLKASVDDNGRELQKVMEWNEKYGEIKTKNRKATSMQTSMYV